MDSVQLFPFAEYWWVYIAFVAGVGVLLAIDLGIFHREAHEVSMKEAGGLGFGLDFAGAAVQLRALSLCAMEVRFGSALAGHP